MPSVFSPNITLFSIFIVLTAPAVFALDVSSSENEYASILNGSVILNPEPPFCINFLAVNANSPIGESIFS